MENLILERNIRKYNKVKELVISGSTICNACEKAKVPRATFYDIKKKLGKNKEFLLKRPNTNIDDELYFDKQKNTDSHITKKRHKNNRQKGGNINVKLINKEKSEEKNEENNETDDNDSDYQKLDIVLKEKTDEITTEKQNNECSIKKGISDFIELKSSETKKGSDTKSDTRIDVVFTDTKEISSAHKKSPSMNIPFKNNIDCIYNEHITNNNNPKTKTTDNNFKKWVQGMSGRVSARRKNRAENKEK